ncbi:MAG: RNA-binding protein [Burkholderiales bacterium]|nr:RNA-binding protein [Burkholderiales bacterium]
MLPHHQMTATIRLAKRVAQEFACSRSQAQGYIEGAWVTVDGVICEEPGMHVAPEQVVVLLAGATSEPAEPVTFLLHKPSGLPAKNGLLAADDALMGLLCAENRQVAVDVWTQERFLRRHLQQLQLLAALDTVASGLLVLTQDYRVERKLRDASASLEQEYVVKISGVVLPELRPEYLQQIQQRNQQHIKPLAGLKISWQSEAQLRLVFKGGLQGEFLGAIEKICSLPDWRVAAIHRLRLGRISLAGLTTDQWRFLRPQERF